MQAACVYICLLALHVVHQCNHLHQEIGFCYALKPYTLEKAYVSPSFTTLNPFVLTNKICLNQTLYKNINVTVV